MQSDEQCIDLQAPVSSMIITTKVNWYLYKYQQYRIHTLQVRQEIKDLFICHEAVILRPSNSRVSQMLACDLIVAKIKLLKTI